MSYNCKHGIEEAFHCFDCEYAFRRTGRLHDEFKTWEFTWSKIHGRSPCAEDGWLADKYRRDTLAATVERVRNIITYRTFKDDKAVLSDLDRALVPVGESGPTLTTATPPHDGSHWNERHPIGAPGAAAPAWAGPERRDPRWIGNGCPVGYIHGGTPIYSRVGRLYANTRAAKGGGK